MKVLIIGGVAGGASAAARLRRLDEQAEIIMFERSGYISYANCGLPYFIGGEIEDKDKLTLQTPTSFFNRFRIDVRVHHEVVEIDSKQQKVIVKNLINGLTYEETYDRLILSPGAKAIKPPIEGIDHNRVFTLRTVEDTFRIHEFIETKKPKHAVVVGGGFIGLEMAENLKHKDIQVTVVQLMDQIMAPLDQDMVTIVQNYLRRQGIKLLLETSLTGIVETNNQLQAVVDNQAPLLCDMIIMSVGVLPESSLTKNTGIKLGLKGSILVNENMQTNVPNIYAVGDVVEVEHYVSKEKSVISLAGPANKQGRIAANHICGIDSRYRGSQGSSILKLFDLTVASTGLNEREAKAVNLDFDSVVLTSTSHATYYPGASSMYIKVVFEKPSGRILGSQIVGFDGVDKRIDVLATAIHGNMTAFDLTELDLAYAPPYSSAKDPVNMAGFVIENILLDKVKQVHWKDIIINDDDYMLLDTRTEREYHRGHFERALNIPIDELRDRIDELQKDKKYYVYCQSGLRSYLACRILMQHGIECYNIAGGYDFYEHISLNEVFNEVTASELE